MKNQNIIKKNHEFQNIIKNKKFIKSNGFIIYFKKNDVNRFRYGVSVGKKIGNAVLRNRVKRQIRALVKTVMGYQTDKNYDVILIVRVMFLNKQYNENLEDLKKSLKLLK